MNNKELEDFIVNLMIYCFILGFHKDYKELKELMKKYVEKEKIKDVCNRIAWYSRFGENR